MTFLAAKAKRDLASEVSEPPAQVGDMESRCLMFGRVSRHQGRFSDPP